MKKMRFKFSRMLTRQADGAAVALIEDFQARYQAESLRHADATRELEEAYTDLVRTLSREYKMPRDLNALVDTSHQAEHGVVFLTSRETEEYEAGGDDHPARPN